MKLSEAIKRVDKSRDNEDWINTEAVAEELGIYAECVEQKKLKAYWLANWYCTDTFVGTRVYFLDDEPVAVSFQSGRKNSEEFQWVSTEAAQKTKVYILSLSAQTSSSVRLMNPDEEIGNHYTIRYNDQLMPRHHKMFYKGEMVEFVKRIREHPYCLDTDVIVKLPDGTDKRVSVWSLELGYYLAE